MQSNIVSVPLVTDTRGAARLLSCHPNTVANLTKRGHLRCVRIGRSVRYAIADIEEYVRRGGDIDAKCA